MLTNTGNVENAVEENGIVMEGEGDGVGGEGVGAMEILCPMVICLVILLVGSIPEFIQHNGIT